VHRRRGTSSNPLDRDSSCRMQNRGELEHARHERDREPRCRRLRRLRSGGARRSLRPARRAVVRVRQPTLTNGDLGNRRMPRVGCARNRTGGHRRSDRARLEGPRLHAEFDQESKHGPAPNRDGGWKARGRPQVLPRRIRRGLGGGLETRPARLPHSPPQRSSISCTPASEPRASAKTSAFRNTFATHTSSRNMRSSAKPASNPSARSCSDSSRIGGSLRSEDRAWRAHTAGARKPEVHGDAR